MVHNAVLMETIRIPIVVSIGFFGNAFFCILNKHFKIHLILQSFYNFKYIRYVIATIKIA